METHIILQKSIHFATEAPNFPILKIKEKKSAELNAV